MKYIKYSIQGLTIQGLPIQFLFLFSMLFITFLLFPYRSVIAKSQNHSQLSKVDPLNVISDFKNNINPGSAFPDTIRILALRAEFVEDALATTTGNGRFDLSVDSDNLIDSPPHNRTYFQHQMLALQNYFKRVSNGKLVIESTVLPEGESSAYQLTQNMVYYSGQENDELKNQRWSELLNDVVLLCKNQDNPDFSKYDAVIIFHAGVGSDFAFDFDPTPYDIQSVFIDFETLKTTIGKDETNYQGIPIGNNVFIKEGIILPETQNQDGHDLALLGTMTLLVGSQLGMPSLFDTNTGRAGIGRWGLMDQGSYNFQGLIPAEPCAWIKIYMGWQEPVVINSGQDIKIGSPFTKSAPHIYKIPISSHEYFLLENRQQDKNKDGYTFGRDEYGKRVQFDSLGSVVADANFGVITRVDDYDFGLPGSGVLIWHIDEDVIRENIDANTINGDRDHRGVDLVECDGAQDIGYYYSLFEPGSGTESGDYYDTYWSGNLSHKIVNDDADSVAFSPYTIPNSNGYNGAVTHINIFKFSAKDSVMTFTLKQDIYQPGFPQYAGKGFMNSSIKPVVLKDESTGVIAVNFAGELLGWNNLGHKIIPNDRKKSVTSIGKTVEYDYGFMASADDSVKISPVICDIDGDGLGEIIVMDITGKVYCWKTIDEDGDGIADLYATGSIGERPSAGLAMKEMSSNPAYILVGTQNGKIVIFTLENGFAIVKSIDLNAGAVNSIALIANDNSSFFAATQSGVVANLSFNGNINWQKTFPFENAPLFTLTADFDGKSGFELAVLSATADYALFSSDGSILCQKTVHNVNNLSAPALGDIDSDGLPELLFNSGNMFYALKYNGIPAVNFPQVTANQNLAGQSTVSPLWLSDTHFGSLSITATPDGMFDALNAMGKNLSGFPVTTGEALAAAPLLLDLDKDNDLECVGLSLDGFIYAWDLNFVPVTGKIWNQYGGSAGNMFAGANRSFLTLTDSELLPKKKVFCYPNPSDGSMTFIRYTLTKDAEQVKIRIYDIAGDLVTEISDAEHFAGEHEVNWNVSNIQSGAYIVRVEAKNSNESDVEFIKIAVVK